MMAHRRGLVLMLVVLLMLACGFFVGTGIDRSPEGDRPSAPFSTSIERGGARRPAGVAPPTQSDSGPPSSQPGERAPSLLAGGQVPSLAASPGAALYSCDCDYDPVFRAERPYPAGADIAGLQAYLALFGFDAGPVDGVYGPRTAAAIGAFQRSRGLEADGILGPRTWVALGRARSSPVAHGPSPPPPGRVEIVIDTADRTLTILSDGKPYKRFPVAVGKPSTPSPQGQWKVASKGAWSGGFGTRWMGLDVPWGKYGIHGTNKPWYIGDEVSGGCIRMFNHDVEVIFDWVQIGTPVVICGGPFGPLRNPRRELGPGERGTDVLAVQRRLRMLGFDPGPENGMYEQPTVDAMKAFQAARGLRVTGVVTPDTYDALGLFLFE